MKQETILNALANLGKLFAALGNNEAWNGYETGITADEYASLNTLIGREHFYNGWFTEENVRKALRSLSKMLDAETLRNFASNYAFSGQPKRVALIMAGNIPLVGFHDFMCVLLSGNTAVCKLSSDDKHLLPAFAGHLLTICPELKDRIVFSTGKLGEIDAVIATGSNNSLRYFESYFGKYPHIFRKNRTSVAVLNGSETDNELHALGEDIFAYFGLGCRNVSFLLVPENFELNRFFEQIVDYGPIIHHHKYANNYDYNRAVFLLNLENLLDNNFVLLREADELFSPLSVLNFKRYPDRQTVEDFLKTHESDIQAVVGRDFIPFGEAQQPEISDFADGVDTMRFLETIA